MQTVPKRLPALDVLRGLAASMIFLFHFFGLYRVEKGDFWQLPNHYIANFFGMGVPLFFALSGLSLCLGYFDKRNAPGFSRDFIIRRYFRIAPLFYTAILGWSAIFISRGVIPSGEDIVLTASFLFNLVPGKHESFVAAGWSVGVEMLFYLVFPVIVLFITSTKRSFLAFCGSFIFAIYAFKGIHSKLPDNSYAGLNLATQCHFFAIGILVFFIQKNQRIRSSEKLRRVSCTLLAGLFIASIWILTTGRLNAWINFPIPEQVGRVIWALPIGLLLLLACWIDTPQKPTETLARLGECSFSLYLLHPLVLYFVNEFAVVNIFTDIDPVTRFALFLSIAAITVVLLSYLSYRWIEQPGMRLGKWFAKRQDNGGVRS